MSNTDPDSRGEQPSDHDPVMRHLREWLSGNDTTEPVKWELTEKGREFVKGIKFHPDLERIIEEIMG